MKENEWIETNCEIRCEWDCGLSLWVVEVHDTTDKADNELVAPAVVYEEKFSEVGNAVRKAISKFKTHMRKGYSLDKYMEDDNKDMDKKWTVEDNTSSVDDILRLAHEVAEEFGQAVGESSNTSTTDEWPNIID